MTVTERIATLTPRQREVIDLVCEGLTNKKIATRLGISTKTVEAHRSQVMEKMGVTNAAQLVRAVYPILEPKGTP